jgi:hypothetical protein
MTKNPIEFKNKITSQWGEDGIIEEIFNRIKTQNKICVEVGSWDGKHLSNTWILWHEKNWSSILIEGDKNKFLSLIENTKNFENSTAINSFVSPTGNNSLDRLLESQGIPTKFDLLSIDIDSDDYYIFKNLEIFTPRVIVIEYNPTIPPELDIVQEEGEYFGASALALCQLAKEKKYKLVCCTETNCFFVLNDDYPLLNIDEPILSEVFPRENLTYVISSQSGLTFLNREPTYSNLKLKNFIPDFIKEKRTHPKLVGDNTIPVEITRKKS